MSFSQLVHYAISSPPISESKALGVSSFYYGKCVAPWWQNITSKVFFSNWNVENCHLEQVWIHMHWNSWVNSISSLEEPKEILNVRERGMLNQILKSSSWEPKRFFLRGGIVHLILHMWPYQCVKEVWSQLVMIWDLLEDVESVKTLQIFQEHLAEICG